MPTLLKRKKKSVCQQSSQCSLLLAKVMSEFCIFRAPTDLCLLWNHNVLEVCFSSWCSCLSPLGLKLQWVHWVLSVLGLVLRTWLMQQSCHEALWWCLLTLGCWRRSLAIRQWLCARGKVCLVHSGGVQRMELCDCSCGAVLNGEILEI